MQFSKMIFIILLLINISSGCVQLNNKNNNIVTVLTSPKTNSQLQLKILWKYLLSSSSEDLYSNLHTSFNDFYIFVANHHGSVKALDINSGREIWSIDLAAHTNSFLYKHSAKLSGGITATIDRIYIGSELAKVYALDAKNGNLIWEVKVAGEVLSSPVVSDNLILIHTSNGMLQAINKYDGTIKWIINLDLLPFTLRGKSTPTTAFGAVIIGDDNGRVSAIMISCGQLIWQQQISNIKNTSEVYFTNNIKATPVVENGTVYAMSYNGNLAALDLYSGQVIWLREIGSINNFLLNNGRIYLVDYHDRVIAVDALSGVIIWCQNNLLYQNLTSPVIYEDYIVVGDSKGYLHWININSGQFTFSYKLDYSGFLPTFVIINDKLIVQTKNGNTYAIILSKSR